MNNKAKEEIKEGIELAQKAWEKLAGAVFPYDGIGNLVSILMSVKDELKIAYRHEYKEEIL